MKVLVILLVLIGFVISIDTAFSMCVYDPSNPDTVCDDTRAFLILDSSNIQLEKFDGVWYYTSESFLRNSSISEIVLNDVTFSIPYTKEPPRYIYTDVSFSDGTNEILKVLLADKPDLSEHINPQAGFIQRTSGYHFLVNANLKELSPLKQIQADIPFDEIQCKQNLVLIQKYDGTPACVTESTKTKLIERGWTKTDKSQIRKPVSVPTPADPMSITINGSSTSLVIPINAGETKEIDILLEPKIPIVSSTVSVESYFGAAGNCNEIDTTSYCPGRGIDMILSDTTITSQKEITLTINAPANMTSGTYAYKIVTDTLFESPDDDESRTVGNSIRFDLRVG